MKFLLLLRYLLYYTKDHFQGLTKIAMTVISHNKDFSLKLRHESIRSINERHIYNKHGLNKKKKMKNSGSL